MVNSMIQKASQLDMNVYDVAVMDANGIHRQELHAADPCTNSYSVAKVFTMTAIGMLWDQKKLRVEDKVWDIFRDELPETVDPLWKEVTLEHLLTHKAGFERCFLDIDVYRLSEYPTDDFLQYIFAQKLQCPPGTRFEYSDAAFYLLSRVVTRLTGQQLDDFLRPVLFGKLHFDELAWSTCPRGYCMGATGLYLRTADMVKLGYVYANEGCYQGESILSAEWVRLALERHYEFSRFCGDKVYAKGGMNGQMLCFSPQHHVACAWHGYEWEHDINMLIEYFGSVISQ